MEYSKYIMIVFCSMMILRLFYLMYVFEFKVVSSNF